MRGVSSSQDPALCPSAACKAGATLVGVVRSDGRVGYVTTPITVDETFVTTANNSGRAPEERFRFASSCATAACAHWHGRCGVVEHAVVVLEPDALAVLPRCSIRRQCRWFRERGRDACAVCPLIVRGTTPAPDLATTAVQQEAGTGRFQTGRMAGG